MGKKSNKTTSQTVYGNTTTTNPYVTSQTTNKGTTSVFNKGTAFESINDFVNNNMNSMLEQYLNPTLNSVTNQAKLNAFRDALNTETAKAMENNIINPLSNRNMIRSSQATNMYNNLAQTNAGQIANFSNDLLANSQKNSADMLSNLLLWYLNGYSAIADNQSQSLNASQGNATSNQSSSSNSLDLSALLQMAAQLALKSQGL